MDDLILIDKEKGWTSFDVVAKIRNAYKKNGMIGKVGHAGTLDPLATGLLLIAVGKKTKEISSLEILSKEYEGQIKLGAITKSYDSEFLEEDIMDISHVTEEEIFDVAKKFIGKTMQIPPMFSALKYKGKRLYELARNEAVIDVSICELKQREIEIFSFELLQINFPFISFRTLVSKGTYIRSIANDFGKKLGVGGYLYDLRRTKVGDYSISNAMTVSQFLSTVSN